MAVDLSILPLIAWYVVLLVFLEGILSADNALVLAVMVRHLPGSERKRALRYGMLGAFGFRAIAVVASAELMSFWYFKFGGGFFLLYLALNHFLSHHGNEAEAARSTRFGKGFWGTVIAVELADIAFSVDSILTAVGVVDGLDARFDYWKKPIVIVGGVLGIITMRFVAGYFITLLERFKGLESGAYVLVAWIGLKLMGSGVHVWKGWRTLIPEWLFWTVMGVVVLASMLYKPTGRHTDQGEKKVAEGEDLHEAVAHGVDVDEPTR
jgi:YkoY family integral membrane protein